MKQRRIVAAVGFALVASVVAAACGGSSGSESEGGTPTKGGTIHILSNGEQIAVGTPLVAGATVSAKVLSHGRHDKVRIFKMRRRKHYQKRQGHRQNYTEILVSRIASAIIQQDKNLFGQLDTGI